MSDQTHSRRHRRPVSTTVDLTPAEADWTTIASGEADASRLASGLSRVSSPRGDSDGPRYVLLRSTDGGLYLWCPVDPDPRTGATVRQLIPVEPVAEEARSLHRHAMDGKDGELAELRRLVSELGRQVVALREQLAPRTPHPVDAPPVFHSEHLEPVHSGDEHGRPMRLRGGPFHVG